jgi:purine nucleoside permease
MFWLRGKYSNGRCRRHPPVVLSDVDSFSTYWPHTDPDDWCGEYLVIVDDDGGKP